MNPIGHGRTADVFEYEEDKIIKLYRKDFPEDAINREFLISNFAFSLGLNTPQPIELTYIDNRQGIVFQRIYGFTLLTIMTKSPWSINKHSRTLATLHSELHTHDASGVLRKQKTVLSHNIMVTPLR